MARFRVLGSGFCAVGALALYVSAPLAAQSFNWPLHNLDLAGSRFAALDQITPANVASLSPRWLFQTGVIDGVSNQTTPVIVDGTMFVTDPRGSVYALDAADGHLVWTFDVTELIGGGAKAGYIFRNRGVCYANGVVYTGAGSFLFALDAKTGKPMRASSST
jgi:glucose dehydrogenase